MRHPPPIGSNFKIPMGKQTRDELVIEASHRDRDDNFTMLSVYHRTAGGYTTSRCYFVRIIEPVGEVAWKILYEQDFATIEDAVNGMTRPAGRYDLDFNLPRPWLSGFTDALERETE